MTWTAEKKATFCTLTRTSSFGSCFSGSSTTRTRTTLSTLASCFPSPHLCLSGRPLSLHCSRRCCFNLFLNLFYLQSSKVWLATLLSLVIVTVTYALLTKHKWSKDSGFAFVDSEWLSYSNLVQIHTMFGIFQIFLLIFLQFRISLFYSSLYSHPSFCPRDVDRPISTPVVKIEKLKSPSLHFHLASLHPLHHG